ncbi:hypothetical protein LEL_06593 [Akanthomyces lecanii RCEF 1005]|uniref:DUF3626 domain-containing protein n=1 Tax=Akanthomyces lecanii RCEF 1005 TaxID=1081108 RepID=A0A168GTS7_CORDF|nr:hypothetical protein LEL_06593 [Akanthomyces lecanii RCEF 1005]
MSSAMETTAINLAPCQQQAIESVRAEAVDLKPESQSTLSHIFRMSNLSELDISETRETIKHHARVVLHFHPDRPAGGRLVAQALLEDGIYKTQFETGISNGLVAAQPGGLRDEWERHLFQGAYQMDGVTASQRPRYGALDLVRNAEGPAPRFGSCFFVLKPHVTMRSTFTFGGSQEKPKYQGTADELDAILAALMEESFTRDFALGVEKMRPRQLFERLGDLKKDFHDLYGSRVAAHNLDHMIEAQIHGEVLLGRDVDALVVDPAFRDTTVGQHLCDMASVYGFSIRYHGGFALRTEEVPPHFRGPTMPSLAKRIAGLNGLVDAACLGIAVQSLTEDPKLWEDRGKFANVLQELKLMWHVLVKYGRPLVEVIDS